MKKIVSILIIMLLTFSMSAQDSSVGQNEKNNITTSYVVGGSMVVVSGIFFYNSYLQQNNLQLSFDPKYLQNLGVKEYTGSKLDQERDIQMNQVFSITSFVIANIFMMEAIRESVILKTKKRYSVGMTNYGLGFIYTLK